MGNGGKPAKKKFNPRDWVVHPNRSEIGPDEPGRNGHFRSVSPPPRPWPTLSGCMVRVELPPELADRADPDGSLTFGGTDNWGFAVGAAHTFARCRTDVEVPNPYGFRHRGKYYWWDGSVTDESRFDGPDAPRYVKEYFERLFPGMPITVMDLR
ncbi:Uncharacterised protein [Mycobacteroides abscessus subsp. abscessus]|uniref:hypothetical protein n=1 Tax=Mycobacteroides abscessus TaxID=36809 RepID=UPI000928CF7F|nr:hypothetical protein [Mycobacteroides abscessus]SHP28273.1 Uncharacterised protein [Mycobacteroides abscessus subsp. abscessus]SHP68154.1 Uncharacterised protein [Mycobacteroides abscessus subsp. abscessus]SHY39061.1 Uncharacterised protein [Mycobacteroides abscessus subsp. abscessus]SKD94103.1 Uncharacterised protein [Mycobacteroides abscessus subsp. abscessus]